MLPYFYQWQNSSTPSNTSNTHNSSIRSDDGLALETSAFQIGLGGN